MPTLRRRGKTGFVGHASTVALAPARALTSHMRRRYHERYKTQYRFPSLVFLFDAFLVGITSTLLVIDVIVFVGGGRGLGGGLELDLTAPPLRASDLAPVQVVIRVTDNRVHEDVSLHWKLPEWVEVVSAQPPIPTNGTILFGKLSPGEERASHLVLRIRASKGTSIPFIFSIHQFDPFGLVSTLSGQEPRTVTDSALTASLAVTSTHATSNAAVPILVANAARTPARSVVLRLTQHDGAPDARLGSEDTQFIGDLAAGERRLAFVDVGPVSASSVTLGWELQDQAQVVDAGIQAFSITTSANPPSIQQSVEADRLSLRVDAGAHPWRLLVEHPRDPAGPSNVLTVPQGVSSQMIPLDAARHTNDTAWSLVPIDDGVAGGILTTRAVFPVTRTIPIGLAVRYYASNGDQLGVGPLPPKVGQATTYWVVWTLASTNEDFSNMKLTAVLADGVHATGKYASPVEGAFNIKGTTVTWAVPNIPASGQAEPTTFAFEISFTPTPAQTNTVPVIVPTAHAEAVSTRTGETLQADLPALTTDATSDVKASGKGTVQP